MGSDRQPTTTGFAILGLLAVRPWSIYELTKQMGRSLHHIWPRAESNVYAEAKRLVDAGFATAADEANGRRPRTVYAITPAGRTALHAWIASGSGPSRYESEAFLKVLFGNEGTRDELLANLRTLRDEAVAAKELWAAVGREYLDGPQPFPGRLHVNALFFRWAWEQADTNRRWAEWALREVEGWPDATGPSDPERSLRVFRDLLDDRLPVDGDN